MRPHLVHDIGAQGKERASSKDESTLWRSRTIKGVGSWSRRIFSLGIRKLSPVHKRTRLPCLLASSSTFAPEICRVRSLAVRSMYTGKEVLAFSTAVTASRCGYSYRVFIRSYLDMALAEFEQKKKLYA